MTGSGNRRRAGTNGDGPVLVHVVDGVARVTLNRPAKLNALNQSLRERFAEVLAELGADDSVKVVVLTGAGGRAFSSGADLTEVGTRTAFERRRMVGSDPANVVRGFEKPVIAMLRGYVLGGGAELAAACDIRIAAESAVFGFPEIGHGWLPLGGGGTQSLPRLVGMGRAMALVLTGERFTAADAERWGFVEQVVPDDQLEDATMALAGRIARHRLRALVLGKAALRMSDDASVDVGLRYERELSTITYYFEDRQEAIDAFAERRAPELGD